jgi:hypothetical protein
VFYENTSVSTIQLPLNLDVSNTIFYIEYQDGTEDTVSLAYSFIERELFRACATQKLISDLRELVDNANVRPVAERDSIQFPPVTNLEIFHN